MKKWTIYLSFGRNKGFGLEKDGPSRRLNLRRFSICVASIDIEEILGGLVSKIDNNSQSMKEVGIIKEQADRFKKMSNDLDAVNVALDKKIADLKDQIEELEMENSVLSDVNDENEELKAVLDANETKISILERNIEYLEIYFGLR